MGLVSLEFIDRSGITVLARGRKLAQHTEGELRLAAPRLRVLRVLTLTQLTDTRLTDVIPSTPALRTIPHGIWGGTTSEERIAIRPVGRALTVTGGWVTHLA